MGLRDLYPHQIRALDGVKAAFRSGSRRMILALPTGAGKTVIGAHIVAGGLSKGKRVVFTVPSLSLIGQTFERFQENGVEPGDMGIIQADHPWTRAAAPIQIASAQTLARREFPITDIVVVDEAHVRHKVYEAWMKARPELPFIGLSATPWSIGLGKLYDTLIKPVSLAELIEIGKLSPYRVFAPSHPDLSGVKITHGDYQEDQLGDAMSTPTLVADVVSTWLLRGENRPTLCFAVNRAHAAKLAHEFTKSGVSTAYVDAFTPREEREELGRRFEAGDVRVVVNIGVLTTGVDWDVRCLILARPTRSEILYTQIIGRALRTAPGKDYALILDHSDTTLRLGMVDEINHDTLSMGKEPPKSKADEKEKTTPMPAPCVACGCLLAPRQRECAECGMPKLLPTGVKEVAGELSELSKGGARKPPKESVTDFLAGLGKPTIYGMLMHVARQRGWKNGVIAHRYHDIFGVWPNGMAYVREIEPCGELQSWLRSRAIAYAKQRRAA